MQNCIKKGMAACALTSLIACTSLSVQEQAKPKQRNLLTKCDELQKHEGTTGDMLLQTLLAWAGQYNECAARHNALVDVVEQSIKE